MPANGPATAAATSVATAPPAPRSMGPAATIGKAVTIKGDIYSEEDLVVDGDVGTGAGQLQRAAPADAPGASGDEGLLAGEFHAINLPPGGRGALDLTRSAAPAEKKIDAPALVRPI